MTDLKRITESGSVDEVKSWLIYLYSGFWDEYGCPLVTDYPLMNGGPWKLLSLIGLYLFFVKVAGPKWMANREAYDLLWPIRIFNAGNVMLNLWGFITFSEVSNFGIDIWKCPKVGPIQTDPYHIWLGSVFLWSRIAEFADTIFFVLRKKNRQVSKLHVFHHSVVPIAFWSVYKFAPTIENGIYPYVNSLVHVLMYVYYTLASFGPSMEPYLWWKKYLTGIQLVQFIAIIVHSMRTAFIPGCQVGSTFFVFLSFLLGGAFFYMFFSFYQENYQRPRFSNRNHQLIVCSCIHNPSENGMACDCGKQDPDLIKQAHLKESSSLDNIKHFQQLIYRNVS